METGIQSQGTVKVDGKELIKTTSFKYLGSWITSNSCTFEEVQARSRAAWMRWRELTGVMCDRRMPLRLKSKVYRTMIRPIILYSAECWPMTKKIEQTLHVTEMKMLRWSLGVTMLDKHRNTEVRRRLSVASITDKARESRLRWFGHVYRAHPDSVAASALRLNIEGPRPRGRPKTRWLDTIRSDMREVAVYERDAADRIKWRSRIRVADPAATRD